MARERLPAPSSSNSPRSAERDANPLWGAPRIHGELLKLGIDVGQTTVAKYMAKRSRPPSQGWKTFLRNHADGIASIDLYVIPTISFRLLYGLLVLRPAAFAAKAFAVGRDGTSKCRMDCPSINRGLRLGVSRRAISFVIAMAYPIKKLSGSLSTVPQARLRR
jgi:hypothetical protein